MNNLAQKEFYTVVIGSSILALNAGVINSISLSGAMSITVSHVTGNITKLAIGIVELNSDILLEIFTMILCFMFGAFMGGFLVGDNKFQLGKSYGVALMIESATLFIAYLLLLNDNMAGTWFATFSCGLQNALTTNYSGAVIRTTHMTGIATDIGNLLGQAARKNGTPELWRLKVHVPLLVSFLLGAIIGHGFFYFLGEHSMIIPSIFAGSVGILYLLLPYIRQAKVILAEANKLLQGQIPGFEVRVIGDPKKAVEKMEKLGIDASLAANAVIHEMGSATNLRGASLHSIVSASRLSFVESPKSIQMMTSSKSIIDTSAILDPSVQSPRTTDLPVNISHLLTMSGGGAVEVVYSSPIQNTSDRRDSQHRLQEAYVTNVGKIADEVTRRGSINRKDSLRVSVSEQSTDFERVIDEHKRNSKVRPRPQSREESRQSSLGVEVLETGSEESNPLNPFRDGSRSEDLNV